MDRNGLRLSVKQKYVHKEGFAGQPSSFPRNFHVNCKPLFYYFTCGPFAVNIHATSIPSKYERSESVFVFASSSAVYLLSAKINCVTSSIFVFFVVVVVVCSLSAFSHFINARSLYRCRYLYSPFDCIDWLILGIYHEKKKVESFFDFLFESIILHIKYFCHWTHSQ